jgi:hypothetical protein
MEAKQNKKQIMQVVKEETCLDNGPSTQLADFLDFPSGCGIMSPPSCPFATILSISA